MKLKKLIDYAKKIAKTAYTPYSKFNVGCSLLLSDGKIIVGHNIENAAYGSTMCAERIALFQAQMEGYTPNDILEIVVFNESEKIISPCGACRQVMVELANLNTNITMVNEKGKQRTDKLAKILPYSFGKEYLDV